MRAITLFAFFVLVLPACGGGGGGQTVSAPSDLRYTSPITLNAGSAVAISPTVTGNVTSYSIDPALPAGLSLDTATGVIAGTPITGNPSASYTITATNGGGSTTFSIRLSVNVGPVGEIKVTGNDGLPLVQVSDLAPTPGESVTVSISQAGAASIVLSTSGVGCGGIIPSSSTTSSLTESGAVGSTGLCVLQAAITTPAGTATYTNQFQITPTNLPPIAAGLNFSGGAYLPSGDLSVLPPSSTLTILNASAPQNFINGSTGTIVIATADPSTIAKALVSFNGIPGYYTAPVTIVNGEIQLTLAVSQNFVANLMASGTHVSQQTRAKKAAPRMPKGIANAGKVVTNDAFQTQASTSLLNSSIQLMGIDGTVSPSFSLPLTFQSVSSGPIQVSLSWGQPVDLDLHVVTPGDEEIYWGNRTDSTGGTLDLDSNAACNIDNIDQENVTWSNSTTPVSGGYVARVDYWSNCGLMQPIPYTVRVTVCGISTIYSGSMDASQADMGSQGAGVTVATVPYTPCAGLSVAGMATYEDYPPTTTGLSTTARNLPIRYATVEVHQSSPDAVLATGTTDATGAFSLTFAMSTPGAYYVKVLASSATANGAPYSQSVISNQGTDYSVQSPTLDASTNPNMTGVTIASTRSASNAGAFNIFDQGINGFTFVQAQYGITLPTLTWQWTPGVGTCGGSASCFDPRSGTIYVLSTSSDTDEYDDSVLLHEFGHFFVKNISSAASIGGMHSPGMRVTPLLAWSEGVPTFFGQSVLSSPTYIDTAANGSISVLLNLETPGAEIPLGTSDGKIGGNLSEANVYALLWDLADPAQDSITLSNGITVTDVIGQKDNVFSVLGALKNASHDRGANGTDLVDFIDQWLCAGYSPWDATAGSNFSGLVTLLDKFPYTPQISPPNCN